MTGTRPLVTRADLAIALAAMVHDDARLAEALATCEAWEIGYVATLITKAEVLLANDAPDLSRPDERAHIALHRAIELENPRGRVERSGRVATPDAVAALLAMLGSRAHFHEKAEPLERRGLRRGS